MSSMLSLVILLLSMYLESGTFAFQSRYECANELSSVPNGSFYLRLVPALELNETEELSCPVDDLRIRNFSCMCGQGLEDQQMATRDRLNESCAYYNESFGNSSTLGFCERALSQMGQCVTFEPISSGDMYSYDEASLTEKLDEVNSVFDRFFHVLDRTIVHVYLPSKEHKCQCLEYYKRWLCSSKLNFVTDTNISSSSDNKCPAVEGNVSLIRPCLGVCYDVLQTCPYYLPARFQPKSNGSDVIYGGYPAFDCPRRQFCEDQGDNCTYGPMKCCFGRKNSGLSLTSLLVGLRLAVLWLCMWLLLCV